METESRMMEQKQRESTAVSSVLQNRQMETPIENGHLPYFPGLYAGYSPGGGTWDHQAKGSTPFPVSPPHPVPALHPGEWGAATGTANVAKGPWELSKVLLQLGRGLSPRD